jgi:hypothetical protein
MTYNVIINFLQPTMVQKINLDEASYVQPVAAMLIALLLFGLAIEVSMYFGLFNSWHPPSDEEEPLNDDIELAVRD